MGTPSYIVRNRFGTYYFRVSLPKHIRASSPGLPKEIRRSLKTNIKSIALLKARLMWVEFYQQFGNQNNMEKQETNTTKKFNYMFLSTAEYLELESNPKIFNGRRLSEVIQLFLEESSHTDRWRNRSKVSVEKSLELFRIITGDPFFSSIKFPQIQEFKKVLFKLPKNFKNAKRYKGLTIKDICNLENSSAISSVTINKHITNVSSLFTWAANNGYTEQNYANSAKIKKTSCIIRERFNDTDIREYFGTEQFQATNGERFKKSWQFWIPLICLFTGARLEEICQLYVSDIHKVDDVWCIDINDEEDKNLKTQASARFTPIHEHLLQLGFLDFVEGRKKLKIKQLFFDIKRFHGRVGHYPSKFFANYLQEVGIKIPSKVFHSFRHTVGDVLKQQLIANNLVAGILGHEDNDISSGTYGSRFKPTVLKPIVDKLRFDIDLEGLKEAARLYK